MRNIKLTIEYDGKDFNGWQKQPDRLNIQGTIENVIESITGEKVELNASRKNRCGGACDSVRLLILKLILICQSISLQLL